MILPLTYGQGSTNLEHIQIIKKVGGKLTDSYLDEGAHLSPQDIFRSLKSRVGFILDKTIGTNCPKRLENAKILIANTCKPISPMFCYSFSSIHTSHGHRQNQGLRCAYQSCQHRQARRTGARREGTIAIASVCTIAHWLCMRR